MFLYYENEIKMLVNVFNAASFMMKVQCFKKLLFVVRYLAVLLYHYYVDLMISLQKSKIYSFPCIKNDLSQLPEKEWEGKD